jgi:hypothetical protein
VVARYWPYPLLSVTGGVFCDYRNFYTFGAVFAALVVLLAWTARHRAFVSTGNPAEDTARKNTGMPSGHPEWLTTPLPADQEAELGRLAVRMWPDAEYLLTGRTRRTK